jgi:site-specific recombinase XerD
MATRRPPRHVTTITDLEESFELALRAKNSAPTTIKSYLEALRLLVDFLERQGPPLDVRRIQRQHIERFLMDQLARHSPATAANRFRSLRVFWNWCVREGELDGSPMAQLTPPVVPKKRQRPLSDDTLRRLLQACEGPDFEDVRDLAIIRLLVDTPMRRSELAHIRLDELRLKEREVDILAKGRVERTCLFGHKTAQALDRYRRRRRLHPQSALPWLWLGSKGPVTDSGIYQFVERRARLAGLEAEHIHPHLFRRTFGHHWLAEGRDRGDLKRLGGWKTDAMVNLYTEDLQDARARDAYRRQPSHGDRL